MSKSIVDIQSFRSYSDDALMQQIGAEFVDGRVRTDMTYTAHLSIIGELMYRKRNRGLSEKAKQTLQKIINDLLHPSESIMPKNVSPTQQMLMQIGQGQCNNILSKLLSLRS